ncbi:MAG: ATP-binding protein [Bdellovibrionota bacterium]|nr:ATP-binding protein [Bdellovibrionota bacterium]
MKEYLRWLKPVLEKALQTRRVVIVSGARQVGKTTLTKQITLNDATFRTLDETSFLTAALDDPADFLRHKNNPLIIDEIQKAPFLLPEIKKIVDNDNTNGQFILTGSANIYKLPTVNESLAGRVKNIHLRALTEGEIQGVFPSFIEKLQKQEFPEKIPNCSKENILNIALRGGYPEAVRLDKDDRKEWHNDYLNALIEHDLKDIASVRKTESLKELTKVLAAWSSKYLDLQGLCSAIGISKPTLSEYLAVINTLYLSHSLPSWIKSDYDRVARSYKFYMTDTGFMSAILNWHYDDIAFDADKYGKLIETFVFNELMAQIDLSLGLTLYQYRDRSNREIDFILEDDKNHIFAIEVKGGSRVSVDDFKHIKWFKDNLVKEKEFLGIILYSGENTLYFKDNLVALPISILWEK